MSARPAHPRPTHPRPTHLCEEPLLGPSPAETAAFADPAAAPPRERAALAETRDRLLARGLSADPSVSPPPDAARADALRAAPVRLSGGR